jgi:hypothetical protein
VDRRETGFRKFLKSSSFFNILKVQMHGHLYTENFVAASLTFSLQNPYNCRRFHFLYITEFSLQGACGIIFPIIKAEGVRQMFFPATVPAYYRAPRPME